MGEGITGRVLVGDGITGRRPRGKLLQGKVSGMPGSLSVTYHSIGLKSTVSAGVFAPCAARKQFKTVLQHF